MCWCAWTTGSIGRVDLTGMIDVATRTVTAAVLRPATKSVDASVLLARTVTPEPMRPGSSIGSVPKVGTPPRPDDGIPGDPPPADMPFTHSRAATGRPGPVEEAIRARRVYDPVVLMRAAAIDNAARQLIIQAENAAPTSSSPDTPTTVRRPQAARLSSPLKASRTT